jgi:lipopolysaccharide heptosyltransferase II
MISEGSLTREFKKILLICFGGIGDVILFFPVIKVLKDLYPHSKIIFTVEPRCKSVAERNPYVDKVITFDLKNNPKFNDYADFVKDLREQNLDLAISIGRSPMVPLLLFLSGAKHRVGYATNKLKFLYSKSVPLNQNQYAGKMYFDLLKGVGIDTEILSPVPEMKIPQDELKWSEDWYKTKNIDLHDGKKTVVVHPGASKISKQKNIIKTWETSKWTDIINRMLNNNIRVILAGGPDDKEDIDYIVKNISSSENFINAYGDTKNLDQLAALIKKSNLLLCIDSAPMNVCVAIGTPLVAIFGPTNEKKILPEDSRFKAVRVNLDCTPCLWDKRLTTCDTLSCIKHLDVNTVYTQVLSSLNISNEVLVSKPL